MKNDKEIEKILLDDKNYEKFLNSKIEKEFLQITDENIKPENKIYKDIKDVPADKLFDRNATYLVMNKSSKTKSFVNGIQAEGFLGSDMLQRNKFLTKQVDYFVCGNNYIKFFKYEA